MVRGMLGVLLISSGKIVTVRAMAEWLWGLDADPPRHRKILYQYVYRLRKFLRSVDSTLSVDREPAGYRLYIEESRVDYPRALALLTSAQQARRRGDHEHAHDLAEQALQLASEPPLTELETPRADALRQKSRRSFFLPAYHTLLSSQLALDRPDAALAVLQDLPPEDEFDLRLMKIRYDALLQTGRSDEARLYHLSARGNLRRLQREDEADELLAYVNRQSHAIPQPREYAPEPPTYRKVPHGLPRTRLDLVGRDRLLAELDHHTHNGRQPALVLFTGAAGVGKTALALHWAHQVRDHCPDGNLYFDLQAGSRPSADDLVRRILRDFDLPADLLVDEHTRLARLASILNEKRMLLLFDDVEEVSQVLPLLDVAPHCLILITSRHRLEYLALHRAAMTFQVPTLPREATERWLRTAIGPRYAQEPNQARELVSLSAGIPLAFQLIGRYVAARPRTSLADITRILHDESRLLDVGHTGEGQALSLRAAFTVSYRRLPQHAQRLFRLLGLHPLGTASLDPLVALAGPSREIVLDAVDILVDSHLLEHHDHGFRLLHVLLYEFASECASHEETTDSRARAFTRLLDWYLHSVSHAEHALFPHRPGVPMLPITDDVTPRDFTDGDDGFDWFVREHPVLIALIRAAHGSGEHARTWRLANAINEMLKRHGHFHDALTCLTVALASARNIDDEQGESGTLNNLGYICMSLGEFNTAYDYFSAAYPIFLQVDDKNGAAIALHNMGYQRYRINDLKAAEHLYQKALDFERDHQLDDARAGTLRWLGKLRETQGKHGEANDLWYQALAIANAAGNILLSGYLLGHLSELHLQRHEYATALDLAQRAVEHQQTSHDLTALANAECLLATIQYHLGHHRQAIETARASIQTCWRTGDIDVQARAMQILADGQAARGNRDAAEEGWARVRQLLHDTTG